MTSDTNSTQQSDRKELLRHSLEALDKMQKKLAAIEQSQREPIAVIGMGCRFPGKVRSPEDYWELLSGGVDAVGPMPKERWEAARRDLPLGAPDRAPVGGFLETVDCFDAAFFGIAAREAESMDPQQRLLLEVAWETIERAGMDATRMKDSRTGVFVGVTTTDYARISMGQAPDKLDAYTATGNALNVTAGRIAFALGLNGPAMAIDTACSSSLVALHLACQSLRQRESDAALAGGVNVILSLEAFICFNRWGMMAPDGRCKTFDEKADGFVRGEGCGMLLLKRLGDAQQSGDPILAVIRGSAVNQDGASSGLTVPNGPAQEAVLRKALTSAGLVPEDIGYVEAHGTGTRLGDPIELEALVHVLGRDRTAANPLCIGSVKTNIGHLESASGVAGVIKVILALQHRAIPPHLHFSRINPQIQIGDTALLIPTAMVPWESHRIAGVSSFGFSGTNAHVVLEGAAQKELVEADTIRPLHLLAVSAKTPAALLELARQYAMMTGDAHDAAGDVCFSANTGRGHFKQRIALIGDSAADFSRKLRAFAEGTTQESVLRGKGEDKQPSGIAFLFTGQGSQYVGMGKQLYETQPGFRRAMDNCDVLLRPYLSVSLIEVLYPEPGMEEQSARLLEQTRVAQPALFALEYALAELWRAWGVTPAAVMGHSVGEYVAACVAGLFSLQDGLKLVAERGRLMQALPGGGRMAAVFADADRVLHAIGPYAQTVSIAAFNGPENTVISGVGEHVQAILESFAAEGISAAPLKVSHAFHSPLVEPMLEAFEQAAAQVRFEDMHLKLVSNLTGETCDGAALGQASFWRRHVREPVRFAESIQTLHEQGCRLFLEIGPHPTLLGMAARCLPAEAVQWLPSLRRGRGDWQQMLNSLGVLYVKGMRIDWQGFDRDYERHKVALPTYPFQRERYWITPAKKPPSSGAVGALLHPLLHHRIQSPKLDAIVFETVLDSQCLPYLKDHRIYGRIVVPATVYLEMAQAAAHQVWGQKPCSVEDFNILQPLFVEKDGCPVVQIIVSSDADDVGFEIYSLAEPSGPGAEWLLHAKGRMLLTLTPAEESEADAPSLQPSGGTDAQRLYERLAGYGIEYGAAFKGLVSIGSVGQQAVGRIRIPDEIADEVDDYALHPALLDICIQVLGAALLEDKGQAGQSQDIYLPMGLKQYRVFLPGQPAAMCAGVVRKGAGSEVFVGDVRIFTPEGALLARIRGMRFKRAEKNVMRHMGAATVAEWLYRLEWKALQIPEAAAGLRAAGLWILFCEEDALGSILADHLEGLGASVHQVYPGHAYATPSADRSVIRPSVPEDMRRLIERVGATGSGTLRGIVYLWSRSVEPPAADAASADTDLGWPGILNLVQTLEAAAVGAVQLNIVTTFGASVGDAQEKINPSQAMLWGLGRVIAAELPQLRCKMIDLAPGPLDTAQYRAFLDEISAPDRLENQIALRDAQRFGLRLVPAATGLTIETHGRPYQLDIPRRGVIDDLKIRPLTVNLPGPGEIQIEIEATGMNFRDVLNVLDMYPGEPGPLGNECVGRVSALGEGVNRFKIGDAVLAITPQAFCSHVNTLAELAVPMPAQIDIHAAATIPIAFLTAEYALTHVAQMKAGEKVLIHAAAGGVGMAAVQLAQRVGAQIFATAGSPHKQSMLRSMGIEHVMSSRTLDFAESIMTATGGQGVDIVLNSLTGEFIPKSMAVLGQGGRFVEIGKIDLWEQEHVAQHNPGISYTPILLGEVCQKDPQRVQAMFTRLLQDFCDGILQPLPVKTFPIGQAAAAFRFMAQAKHIGKIVIDQGDAKTIRSDAAYVITGGLGGLGLSFARWLMEGGARHLILFSRRPAGPKQGEALLKLEAAGATVTVVVGDVADPADLRRLLSRADAVRPIKGIIHAAGVVDDAALRHQDKTRFGAVLHAKAHGAWHLHRLTKSMDLDFFVLCSSASAVFGAPGQANYASANAFMDALAGYRHYLGLPALSINWGPWSDVGLAADLSPEEKQRWASLGIGQMKPDDALKALTLAMATDDDQLAVLPVDWSVFIAAATSRPPMKLLEELLPGKMPSDEAGKQPHSDPMMNRLEQADQEDRYDLLLAHMREQVRGVLGLKPSVEFGPDEGFSDLGMDSLMAVELSNRLQYSLRLELPSTIAFEYPTLTQLTNFLAAKIIKMMEVLNGGNRRKSERGSEAIAILEKIDELSDDEVEALLNKIYAEDGEKDGQ